jgi:hypothetical protein
MNDTPKATTTAAPLEPTFLDRDALPLRLPRTATKFHLSEQMDLKSWLTPDTESAATREKKS